MTHRRIFQAFSRFAPFLLFPLTGGCSDPAEDEKETNPWSGQTYLLDVQAQDWFEPRGIGQEIDDFVPNFLLRVDGDAPDIFDVTLGTADTAGAQDRCNKTTVVGATAAPPGVMIGPSEYSLFIQHVSEDVAVQGTIYDLEIKDVLPNADGTPSEIGELYATMDFRELYRLFTILIDPTPEKVCTQLSDFNAVCGPCPNDGEPFCLTVKANSLGATPAGSAIEPIDSVDDPACEPTP